MAPGNFWDWVALERALWTKNLSGQLASERIQHLGFGIWRIFRAQRYGGVAPSCALDYTRLVTRKTYRVSERQKQKQRQREAEQLSETDARRQSRPAAASELLQREREKEPDKQTQGQRATKKGERGDSQTEGDGPLRETKKTH